MEEQLKAASIHTAAYEGYRLASTTLVLAAPYVVGQAVAFFLTALTFPPGFALWLEYAAFGLFTTLLSISMGWAIGRMLKSGFSALVAALGWLLLVGFLSSWGDFVIVSGSPEFAVSSIALTLRLALVAAFFITLATVPSTTAATMRRVLAPTAAALMLAVVSLGTGIVVQRQPPETLSCTSGRIALCIWPEHMKYLPQLTEVSSLAEALPPTFIAPKRINQYGIDPIRISRNGGTSVIIENPNAEPSFTIIEGSRWSYSGGVARAILASTYESYGSCNWAAISDADKARSAAVDAWLETYLAGGGAPDYRTNASPSLSESWAVGRRMANGASKIEQFHWAEAEVAFLAGQYCKSKG
jgi:hypothetical protein